MFDTFQLDLEGVSAAGAISPPEAGPYKVRIISSSQYEVDNDHGDLARIRFECLVEGPKYGGHTIRDGFNVPDPGNAERVKMLGRFWKAFLLSCGYDNDKLNRAVKLTPKHFEGRTAYVNYTPREDEDGWDKKTWITASQYEALCLLEEATANDPDVDVAPAKTMKSEPEPVYAGSSDTSVDPLDALDAL